MTLQIKNYIILVLIIFLSILSIYSYNISNELEDNIKDNQSLRTNIVVLKNAIKTCNDAAFEIEKAVREKSLQVEELLSKAKAKSKPLEQKGLILLSKSPVERKPVCEQAENLINDYVLELK